MNAKRIALIALSIGALVTQMLGDLRWALGGLLALIIGALIADRKALRFLGKIHFWILSLVIGCLAGLFLGDKPEVYYGVKISIKGLTAGAGMVVRSAVLLLSMALLARSIQKDRFMRWAERLGLKSLAPAVDAAISYLPGLCSRWAEIRKEAGLKPKAMFALIVRILDETARMAEPQKRKLFAVTGAVGAGKTVFLLNLAQKAKEKGIRIAGFLQLRVPTLGTRDGYELKSLADDRIAPLASFDKDHFVFDDAGFTLAKEALDAATGAEILFLDELGHQEAAGKGHLPAIEKLLSCEGSPLVLCCAVCKRRLDEIAERLGPYDAVLDLDSEGEREGRSEKFTAELLAAAGH